MGQIPSKTSHDPTKSYIIFKTDVTGKNEIAWPRFAERGQYCNDIGVAKEEFENLRINGGSYQLLEFEAVYENNVYNAITGDPKTIMEC